jgi:ATP-binding cassette, subfamily G (WHITE), member 4
MNFTVPSESRVFHREYSNNWYSIEMYYLSKWFAELPLQLICPFMCVSVAYYMTGQPMELDRFLMMLGICTVQAMIAHAIGLLAGVIFSLQMGIFMVPAVSIPMLMFSGFFIKAREMFEFLRPLASVSFFRFSFENTLIAILGFERKKLKCLDEFCYFKWPKNFINLMDIKETNFDFNACMLVVWYLGLQLGLYVALKVRVRQHS